MKKEDVPQDVSALGKLTTEVCYATDSSGKYVATQSRGWDVKITALDTAWEDIEVRIAAAKQKVLNEEASPLLFFMELNIMDLDLLADYTGYWKWQVKRHLLPGVFKKLADEKLQRYAKIFNVSVAQLKNMEVNGA